MQWLQMLGWNIFGRSLKYSNPRWRVHKMIVNIYIRLWTDKGQFAAKWFLVDVTSIWLQLTSCYKMTFCACETQFRRKNPNSQAATKKSWVIATNCQASDHLCVIKRLTWVHCFCGGISQRDGKPVLNRQGRNSVIICVWKGVRWWIGRMWCACV